MNPSFNEKEVTSILSDDELEKGGKFRFERDRNRYYYFHAMLRRVLARYCRIRPQDLAFECNEWGKPRVRSLRQTRVMLPETQFSFSHSHNLAVCAVSSRGPLGVDVEQAVKDVPVDEISRAFFSSEEQRLLQNQEGDKKISTFYSLWTGKEAYGKAKGVGISYPLDEVIMPIASSTIFKGLDAEEWRLKRFFFLFGSEYYILSLVSEIHTQETDVFVLD